MKFKTLTSIAAIALFAALSTPIQLAAQEQTTHFRHYRLIDMGTFGGPESAVNGDIDVNDRAVNNRGMTVGFSATPTRKLQHSHPFICGGDNGVGSFITHAFQWRSGTVTDLSSLPPTDTDCSNAFQVNAIGEIAGFSENGGFDPLLGFNQSRAVRWKNGNIEDLGSFGGNQNEALAINNRGEIVGFSTNTIVDPFSPEGTQIRAFLWRNGRMQDLGTLGSGNGATAAYINERGQIAGISFTSTTPNAVTAIPPLNPFLWENGTMVDLGTLGGAYGQPTSLNNRGQVIGVSSTVANPGACFTELDPNCHPFLWDQGQLIDLNTSTMGGNPLSADGINDAKEIVGGADFSSTGGSPFDAYIWRKGVATDLGAVPGDCFSRALAINAHGQVVGNSFSCNGDFQHAFLWENGSIVDLNTLIPADSGLQLVDTEDINDRGEIPGTGVPPSNVSTQGHAFLLIPVCADGTEGCADAPLDPLVAAQSRAVSGAVPKTMTAEELARFKERIAGESRRLWPRRLVAP